jgi:tetratricopeptide (TPR) repeat protein
MWLARLLRWLPRGAHGRALTAFNRGDFATAVQLFEEVLAAPGSTPPDIVLCACEAYAEWSAQRAHGGDVAGAIAALERAAALRPHYADVHFRLGRLYQRADQVQRARAAYERALEINPRYFEARLALARLLVHLDAGEAALRHLHEAARSGPEYAAGHLQELLETVPAHGAASANSRSRLEALLDTLLAGPPSPVAARLEIARAALRAGDNIVAITELKRMLEQHPTFPDLHNLLGVAYDHEEMTDDAIEEFETALRLKPDYIDARLNLGLALVERGRDAEALRHLQRVAGTQPDNAMARDLLHQIATRSAAR